MLKKGETLKGLYTVIETVSFSGGTNVYLVEDSRKGKTWIMKEYTIKIDNPLEVSRISQRFEKELTILAGIKNPGIPVTIDHFFIVDRHYVIMEYVTGKTLSRILQESTEPMSESDVVEIALQITGVIAFLHEQSPPIILRNLNPDNIIITPDKRAKIVDFGMGRHFRTLNERATKKLTTPGYSPPEQLANEVVDERTDVYALGAILHQLLTLRNPGDISRLFKFPPANEVNPVVSQKMAYIIKKATSYSQSGRYMSMLEMRRDLESLFSTIGEKPKPPKRKGLLQIEEQKPPEPVRQEPVRRQSESYQSPKGYKTREIPASYPESKAKDGKTGKLLLSMIAGLLVILILLGLYYVFVGKADISTKNTVESPFAFVKDQRILDIREEGIEHYKKGEASKDRGELALAMSILQQVVTAHPTDVISQVYVENARILMQKKPYVKVGFMASLTGSNFEAGRQLLAGVCVGQTVFNKNNKTNNIFIEIYDNQSKNEENIKISAELSKRNDLLAVIGPIRSPLLASASQFFSDGKVVLISPTGSCPDIENLGDYIYRMTGDGRDLAIDIAAFSTDKLGLKRVAVVIDPTQSYSKILGEIYRDEIDKASGIECKMFTTSLETDNFSNVLKQVKKYKPDGVFFVAYHNQQGKFAKQMKKMGIETVYHLSTVATYSDQLITEGGEAVEGIVFNSYFFPSGGSKVARNFIKDYEKKFPGVNSNFRAALAYDTVFAIGTAIKNGVTNSVDLDGFLKNSLGKKVDAEGVTGKIVFDRYGRREKILLIHLTVRNGRFERYD